MADSSDVISPVLGPGSDSLPSSSKAKTTKAKTTTRRKSQANAQTPARTEPDATVNPGTESEQPNTPEGKPALSTFLISISLVLAVFLVALDTTILSTAIPKITDDFESLTDVGWYGGVYSLTSAVFQLMFGKFYTVFSVKYTFLVAIVIFEGGSVLCAAAPTSEAFIIGRALAGVGSAGIFAGAFIVVAQTIPLRWRSIYNGIFGALYGIASVVGPTLGGVLTDTLSWRWCFWINLPVGVITVVVMIFCFKPEDVRKPEDGERGPKTMKDKVKGVVKLLDVPSTTVLMASTICLLLALQWGGVEFSWHNGRIIALLVVTSVSTMVFIAIQLKMKESAFLPLRILKQRTVWACCWFAFSAGSSVVILIYYLPIWFQAVLGVSALKSGLLNLPFVISLVASSFLSGAAVSFVGYYTPFLIFSSALRAIGAGLLTTLTPESRQWEYILYQIIFGIGDGAGMQQPLIAVQNVLDEKDVPMGISVLIFTQTLGGAIFVAVGQSVFTDRLVSNVQGVNRDLRSSRSNATMVDAGRLVKTGATAYRGMIADKSVLSRVIGAYSKAITDTFLIAVVLACVSIFGAGMVEWRKVSPDKQRRQSVAVVRSAVAGAAADGDGDGGVGAVQAYEMNVIETRKKD